MSGSWDQSVFDRIYASADDPWDFQGSPYEAAKYAETLAALPGRRFVRGLEIGCSIGVQTRLLAARCEALLAVDLAPEAVHRARTRCADLAQVEIRQAQLPRDFPPGRFDLIVLSEVLYFLDSADIASMARLVAGALEARGVALLVNWTGLTDTPTTGDAAAALFCAGTRPGLRCVTQLRRDTYRLDLLEASEGK